MPDEITSLLRRLDMTERNQSDLAKTITELTLAVREVRVEQDDARVDKAVREERNKALNERLERIERSIEHGFAAAKEDVDERFGRLNKPLWMATAAFISVMVGAFATFIIKGGLIVSP